MSLESAIVAFHAIVVTYFVLGNVLLLAMGAAGARFVWRYQRRRNVRSRALEAWATLCALPHRAALFQLCDSAAPNPLNSALEPEVPRKK